MDRQTEVFLLLAHSIGRHWWRDSPEQGFKKLDEFTEKAVRYLNVKRDVVDARIRELLLEGKEELEVVKVMFKEIVDEKH